MAVKAAILGASGFAGGELLRLLEAHPAIQVVAAGASTKAGKRVTEIFPSLGSYAGVAFCDLQAALGAEVDLLFSSLPHGESSRLLGGARAGTIVDLAGDFRLAHPEAYREWYGTPHPDPSALDGWVYGLSEFHRQEISAQHLRKGRDVKRVANPGCYAAASILALAPLIEAGLLELSQIHISAMSGVSGAGRAQGEGFDFVSSNENVRAYKPTGHNHIAEIEQELEHLAGKAVIVSFVPHLVPMNRGIFVTVAAQAAVSGDSERLRKALAERYHAEPFVRVLEPPALPETKRLSGTNFAEVAVTADQRTGKVLAFAAIDNLGKGAAGQAIQNANLLLGLEETTGLLAEGLIA